MELHEALELLARSTATDPVLIQFDDDAELMIVPRPHLTDVSWCHRGRGYQVLMTRTEILKTWAENDDPDTISGETFRLIANVMMSY